MLFHPLIDASVGVTGDDQWQLLALQSLFQQRRSALQMQRQQVDLVYRQQLTSLKQELAMLQRQLLESFNAGFNIAPLQLSGLALQLLPQESLWAGRLPPAIPEQSQGSQQLSTSQPAHNSPESSSSHFGLSKQAAPVHVPILDYEPKNICMVITDALNRLKDQCVICLLGAVGTRWTHYAHTTVQCPTNINLWKDAAYIQWVQTVWRFPQGYCDQCGCISVCSSRLFSFYCVSLSKWLFEDAPNQSLGLKNLHYLFHWLVRIGRLLS
ncbi:hypothetical protein GGX14DRAFT_393626 [Mycena pura]|uniref:Uncharacterized protein n=1 Tax=Mycena pura TaxID=153505 RepID=A0AAD6YBI0_9AGAR|nr:hypothetical protein GGX14DRAFT_393626 [Mycena pura]